MTTDRIKKYIQERNYHLTENDIKELFKSPQVVKKENLLGGRMARIITNDNKDFTVMIIPNED